MSCGEQVASSSTDAILPTMARTRYSNTSGRCRMEAEKAMTRGLPFATPCDDSEEQRYRDLPVRPDVLVSYVVPAPKTLDIFRGCTLQRRGGSTQDR